MALDWSCGALAEGLRCYRNEEFFLAHEHWEAIWLHCEEPEKTFLQAFRSAGMQVTLGLGLEDPPSWVFSLPNSSYVNQAGVVARQANFVFSEDVRQAAGQFLKQVSTELPLSDFWAIRLTSGGNGEMLYPAGASYWASNSSALNGVGLPPSMTANPFPNWRPGQSGLSPSQIDQWVNWYVGGLDNVTAILVRIR